LNRRTRLLTVVPLRKPAARAAGRKPCPCATDSSAAARRTRSSRSLLAFVIAVNSRCSATVSGRSRSFCMVAMMPSLCQAVSLHHPLSHTNAA